MNLVVKDAGIAPRRAISSHMRGLAMRGAHKSPHIPFLAYALTALLLSVNFLPQRLELLLNAKAGNFPVSYIGIGIIFALTLPSVWRRGIDKHMWRLLTILCLALFTSIASLVYNDFARIGGHKPLSSRALSLVYLYGPVFLAPAAYWIAFSRHTLKYFMNLLLMIVLGQAIIGLACLFFSSTLLEYFKWDVPVFSHTRAHSSLIGGTGPLAFLLLIGTPLFFLTYVSGGRMTNALGFGISFLALIYTYSRAPLFLAICAIMGISLYCLKARQSRTIMKRIKFVGLIGFLGLSTFLITQDEYNLGYLVRRHTAADSIRVDTARAACVLWWRNPVAGQGPGELYVRKYEENDDKHIVMANMESLKTPHSLYLLLAAEHGLICVALWAAFILCLLRIIRPPSVPTKTNIRSWAFFLTLVAVCTYSLVTDTLAMQYRAAPTFWYFVGICMAHTRIGAAPENCSA